MLHQSLALPLATLLSLLYEAFRKVVGQVGQTAKNVRIPDSIGLDVLVAPILGLLEPALDVLVNAPGSLESRPSSTKLGRVSKAIASIALDLEELKGVGQEDLGGCSAYFVVLVDGLAPQFRIELLYDWPAPHLSEGARCAVFPLELWDLDKGVVLGHRIDFIPGHVLQAVNEGISCFLLSFFVLKALKSISKASNPRGNCDPGRSEFVILPGLVGNSISTNLQQPFLITSFTFGIVDLNLRPFGPNHRHALAIYILLHLEDVILVELGGYPIGLARVHFH